MPTVVTGLLVSGGSALLMPELVGFFTRTLPFPLRGDDDFLRLYEASLGWCSRGPGYRRGYRRGRRVRWR